MNKPRKPEPLLIEASIREWRILREFPDYEISNDGRLRRRTDGKNRKAGSRIRVIVSNANPYPKYGLTTLDGRRLYRNAHRLVAAEFLPPSPEGKPWVLHKDDNKLNCCDTNLKWGCLQDNINDAHANGLIEQGSRHSSARKPWYRPRGENHSKAKLNESQVLAIFSDTRKQRDIAEEYGVDQALIGRIRTGKIWKHVTNPAYRHMLEKEKNKDG